MKIRLAIGVLLMQACAANAASLSASPSPNSNGNFTVSWAPHSGTDWYELTQQINGGGWTKYVISPTSTSKTFSSKPQATYTYKLRYCENFGRPDEFACYDTGYGKVDVVVKALPWPDPAPLAEQLQYSYETRVGNINADSYQDLLVRRTTSSESGNGSIDTYILQQKWGGGVSVYVPSATQLSDAMTWPTVASDILVEDLNSDDFADIVLRNIPANVGIADQIIYAPAKILHESPKAYVEFSDDMKAFSSDMANWYLNPNYLEDNSVWIAEQGHWDWDWICHGRWRDHFGWDCGWERVWKVDVPAHWEYPGINEKAVDVLAGLIKIGAGQGSQLDVRDIIEQVFGVRIGGRSACFDTGRFAANYCIGLELNDALLGLAAANNNPNTASARSADTVYVTGHKVIGFKNAAYFHAAIEYRPKGLSISAAQTISAGPSENSLLGTMPWGKLISAINRPTDRPNRNITLGTVISLQSALNLPVLHFAAMVQADTLYGDCLDYDPAPELMSGSGYNSNGFVKGLLDVTHATTTAIIHQLPGWATPVPGIEFSANAPPCP